MSNFASLKQTKTTQIKNKKLQIDVERINFIFIFIYLYQNLMDPKIIKLY